MAPKGNMPWSTLLGFYFGWSPTPAGAVEAGRDDGTSYTSGEIRHGVHKNTVVAVCAS